MDRRMKNVLILCDAFPPAFNPRMGYLCKYLPEFGWNPIIITEYSPQLIFTDLAVGKNVRYINFYWSKNKFYRALKYTFVFFADLLFNYKAIIVKKEALKTIKKYPVDLILSSSSCRTYSALVAQKIAKKQAIPFVMDLRDIVEQFPSNEHISKTFTGSSLLNRFIAAIITRKYLRQRNKIIGKAATVTTVSKWHKEKLSELNNNVQLIYNGYAPDLFYKNHIATDRFLISYTGRIESSDIKDPSLLFEAVYNLWQTNNINPSNLRIQFYLIDENSKKITRYLAQKYKVENFVDIFNTIESCLVPEVLNKSSILLLLANKADGEKSPHGIIGTKVFEYLAVQKPILCVRNDKSYLEELLANSNAGLAASTIPETTTFILEKYTEWQQNGITEQHVKVDFIQQFSRKYQAQQFVAIFENLLQNSARLKTSC